MISRELTAYSEVTKLGCVENFWKMHLIERDQGSTDMADL